MNNQDDYNVNCKINVKINLFFVILIQRGDRTLAHNRKLENDADFQEAMDRQVPIRVFQNDQMIDSGGIVIRFTEQFIIVQTGVSGLTYHPRELCEFFGMKKQ